MIKKTITFDDLDGNPVTEDFYFHISRSEIIEMDLDAEGGGIKEKLEAVANSNDNHLIFNTFKEIVLAAIGRRSEDGVSFIKDDETRQRFENSEAFTEFVFELMQTEGAAAEFVRGALPKNLGKKLPGEVVDTTAPAVSDGPTDEELLKMRPQEMTRQQLERAMALKLQG